MRILGYADGSRRVVVDITGMKSVNPFALHDTTQPLSAAQDMFGLPSTYEAGVLAAMRAAGVRSSDDVMLVGHSEGGMVAVNAARAAVASGEYRVTHVITAGSPIAITAGRVPSSVKVLALENDGDAVPCLDGAANPGRGNVTTVTVHHHDGSLLANHDLSKSYLPGARDVDASTDTSVEDYLATRVRLPGGDKRADQDLPGEPVTRRIRERSFDASEIATPRLACPGHWTRRRSRACWD